MRGFLIEKSKISLIILMLTIKHSSNFNKGNVHYEEIRNLKKQDLSCYCNANNQSLLKFQQRKRKFRGNS